MIAAPAAARGDSYESLIRGGWMAYKAPSLATVNWGFIGSSFAGRPVRGSSPKLGSQYYVGEIYLTHESVSFVSEDA